MSTIKVDTIATRTGSGNITLSNNVASLTVSGAFTSQGIDDNANNTAIAIDTNEDFTITKQGTNTTDIRLANSSNSFGGNIKYDHNVGNMIFHVHNGERMRFRSDGGICFNGDTAAANALDDYEEVTWTPTFVSTSASFSYSTQGGNYTKVGRLVFANFRIQLSGSPSGTTSNVVFVGGLPFVIGTQVGTYHGGHPGHYFNFNLSQTGTLAYQLPQGESKVELKVVGDNLGETAVLASHLNSTAQIRGQILYHTA